jgi:hypothetical protein
MVVGRKCPVEMKQEGEHGMKTDFRNKRVATPEPPRIEGEIRTRAYELFEARGREEGHELEDWLRAEEEIVGRKTEAVAA